MKELILLISLYLLVSTKGASGQPDELLDSMDRQASVQHLSSEYFSLANPSDVEALYETSSIVKALNDHSNEHSSSEHAVSEHEHISGEHTSPEQSTGEHAEHGEQVSGDHPTEEQASGEHPSKEPSSGEQVSGEKGVEEPSEHNLGEEASVEHNSGEMGSDEQAMSTSFPSTSSAISCHTCAYMNEDGKCLRGEGVCTTQNSQQCMLKKIFEGGKLQFMVQGCENMCPSMNLFSHGTRMQIMCCQNEPLCNKI
uniref:Acrosomal vesicle protein 1 n=1 Tax=Nannospalax galili TaxID=1026970 RepID=A0A8C6W4C6_NANGA